MKFRSIYLSILLLCSLNCSKSNNDNPDDGSLNPPSEIGAFSQVEGFGKFTSGGRGGSVVYVTNLNQNGPGSLQAALDNTEARYILFKVSGHIPYNQTIDYGNFYLAGQTSPAGIVMQGIISSSNETTKGLKNNFIIRHIRSRECEDPIRLNYNHYVVIDHCSFSNPNDEVFQFSRANHVSVQNCIMAESERNTGGMLYTYSEEEFPLNDNSIHHNLWYRLTGRIPELCYQLDYSIGRVYNLEYSNNVQWDPGFMINCVTNLSSAHETYWDWKMNMVNNYSYTRSPGKTAEGKYPGAMMNASFFGHGKSELFVSGNEMNTYPGKKDYQLCGNNEFYIYNNNYAAYSDLTKVQTDHPETVIMESRHPFPEITYTETSELIDYMIANAGAFPRDTQDKRYIDNLKTGLINTSEDRSGNIYDDSFTYFDNLTEMPAPLLDSDDDGMPDYWELHNGLNPLVKDHNEKNLSVIYSGIEGYDNIEVYLNCLSDYVVAKYDDISGNEISITKGDAYKYAINVTGNLASTTYSPGDNVTLNWSVDASVSVNTCELSMDQITNPFETGISTIDLSSNGNNNNWQYSFKVPTDCAEGEYHILVHIQNSASENGYYLFKIIIN